MQRIYHIHTPPTLCPIQRLLQTACFTHYLHSTSYKETLFFAARRSFQDALSKTYDDLFWLLDPMLTSFNGPGHCEGQPIRADFISSKKLPARLDRLLGKDKYQCHWQLNHYIISGTRDLTEVIPSDSLFKRLESRSESSLSQANTPLTDFLSGRNSTAETVTLSIPKRKKTVQMTLPPASWVWIVWYMAWRWGLGHTGCLSVF